MQRSCPKEHESAFTCSSLFMVNRRNAQPYYEHIQVFLILNLNVKVLKRN